MERKFNINEKSVDTLKKSLYYHNLKDCILTLEQLINYTQTKIKDLFTQLNKNISLEEKNDILRKIAIAERKFRHMLDVPMLCLKRIDINNYKNDKAILLTIIGILHDIGRIDEIISQDKNSVFKGKVDHAAIGATYLVKDDNLTIYDNIHKFVPLTIAAEYWQIIKNCVLYHGSLNIPEEIFKTDLEKSLIHDIRLIDKSSIMNSFLYEDIESVIGISKEQLSHTNISDVTFEELTNEKQVDRKKQGELYTPNRQFMSHVGFIYDMDDYSMLTDDWVTKYLDIYMPIDSQDQLKKELIHKCAVKRISRLNI